MPAPLRVPVLLAALVATLCGGCDRGAPPNTPPGPAITASEKWNVVLVSVDTTRADHLGCYGHPTIKTPNIDRLASAGTRFARCISPAPVTLPAHASLLTGAYPFVHGARSNGTFQLGPENTTLTERFKEAGYATGAEVAAAVMGRLYGLDQGFDHYGDLLDEVAAETVTQGFNAERTATRITDRGIAFIEAHRDEPFFLFLHYYDPHEPYEPPEPYASQYPHPYLGEVAYFDAQFGRVLDALTQHELDDRTLVILTSDHGESMGEHQELGHAYFLYDTTLLIPLIFRGPQIPPGQVVTQQVRLIDVAPTLASFFGWEATPENQGRSLLPLMLGQGSGWEAPAYSDTFYPAVVFGFAHLRSLRTEDWKYVHAPQPELYNLSQDPGENNNLAASDPKRTAQMRDQLRTLIETSPTPPQAGGGRITMSEEQRRKLESLGYIGGGESEEVIGDTGNELDNFDTDAPDLKAHADAIHLYGAAMQTIAKEDWAGAIDAYTKLLAVAPESGAAHIDLGRAQAALQQLDAALASYQKAAALQPKNALPPYLAGQILAFVGRQHEAEVSLKKAIEIDPSWVEPVGELGRLFLRQRRFEEAAETFEHALTLKQFDEMLRVRLGRALSGLGQYEAAEAQLRRAISNAPDNAPAKLFLGELLLNTERIAEGRETLEAAHALAPQDPRALDRLAGYYVRAEQFEEAIAVYERAAKAMPDSPLRHHNLGTALRQAGRPADSIAHYRRAIEVDPDGIISVQPLVLTLRELGRTTEASEVCASALEKIKDGRLRQRIEELCDETAE